MTVVAMRETPTLAIGQVRTDGSTQSRTRIDDETVAEYAEAMKSGARFPPVDVFYDGRDFWLADGFHRVRAYRKTGASKIEVRTHRGTKREALLFSIRANATHGLRRTNADKRRAVEMLLGDEEWSTWTDRVIATAAGVSQELVRKLRREVTTVVTSAPKPAKQQDPEKARPARRTGRDGKSYPTKRATRSRELEDRDAKIRELRSHGHPQADIARTLKIAASVVCDSLQRQGIKRNPLARLIADLDGLATALRNAPDGLLAKATREQKDEAIQQLKVTVSAAHQLIRQLKGAS